MMLDDEVSVSNFIGEVLRDHGYDVAIFSESPTAMRYLEAHRDEVAMILTDQMMPLMTGLELSEQAERPRDSRRMAEIGVNRFLAKPFRIDELLNAIQSLAEHPAAVQPVPLAEAD
jgi:CheY-like chemotaxis protein